ncbi:hypothetical protein RRG08_004039 [Elysia crispata]|uniref:EF-hand domain-containing protein n=1 Tax=Elysia crispata TaxID=231223 RepID=A0AAE1ANG6_9GAST|nr:hypothetical protein RRG08_004039 [Elysia crispata]
MVCCALLAHICSFYSQASTLCFDPRSEARCFQDDLYPGINPHTCPSFLWHFGLQVLEISSVSEGLRTDSSNSITIQLYFCSDWTILPSMLTVPWLLTSTVRDLMRFPRHHPQLQSLQQQQQHQQLQEQKTVVSSVQTTVSQVQHTNVSPLVPKPQPSPLRPEQTEIQTKLIQQQQHQKQQQQQQQQQQQKQQQPQQNATSTTGVGKQLTASTSMPQQSTPQGQSARNPSTTPGKSEQGPQRPTDSPRLRRAFIEPPGLQQLQSNRSPQQQSSTVFGFEIERTPSESAPKMTDQWAQQQVEKFVFDFDRADKDKNGSLSCQEVIDVLKAVGFKGTDEEAQSIFTHLDKNKDARISKSEFKASMDKLPKLSIKEFVLRKTFKSLDKDNSGYLTKTEVMDALKSDSGINISAKIISDILIYISKEDDDEKVAYDEFLRVLNFEESASVLNQIFRRLDKDGNGNLTLDEMNAAIAAEGELAKLKPRIIQLLKYHGKDLDKKINYHEFVSAWLKKKEEQ